MPHRHRPEPAWSEANKENVNSHSAAPHFLTAWRWPEIRLFIGATAFYALASRALIMLVNFQVYAWTHSVLALGLLGLVEAIPALSLALVGGYAADRWNRRRILLIARLVSVGCALLLAWLAGYTGGGRLSLLYLSVFLIGIARGFADPAATAFEAQVVPPALTINATAWIASTWLACAALGPAVGGVVYARFGGFVSYVALAVSFALSWLCTWTIAPKRQPLPATRETIFRSIATGLRFVRRSQPLLGSMALDLFAVLFGGMVALLPVFASDILHVGPRGLGLLNAAPAVGSLLILLWSTHRPPIRRAGRNLLLAVTGFGISVVVFAFSRNFALSCVVLFFSGAFDGISVVIRRAIMRFLSPEELRGRISAVSWIFIGASNEIGAFESGLVAHWIGAIPCVWAGGLITLLVAGLTARWAPQLRRLGLDPSRPGGIIEPTLS